MPTYIVNSNAQSNGDHEVHDVSANCQYLPSVFSQVSLGYFSSCSDAVSAANNKGYSPANGCFYCVNDCHTR